MDRGAWEATVYKLAKSDTTEHTHADNITAWVPSFSSPFMFLFSQIIHLYVVSHKTEVVIMISSAFPTPLTFML